MVDNKSCIMQRDATEMGNCHADNSVLSLPLKLVTDICCAFAIVNNCNGKEVSIFFYYTSVDRIVL